MKWKSQPCGTDKANVMGSFDDLRQSLGQKSLDELADWMASIGVVLQNDQVSLVEFLLRLTLYAEDAA